MGAKNRPFYRLVATDMRMPRDGRFIEALGHYQPIEKPAKIFLNEDRIFYWMDNGAVISDTVNSLFKEIGLLKKWSKHKKGEDISEMQIKGEIKEKTKKKKRTPKPE